MRMAGRTLMDFLQSNNLFILVILVIIINYNSVVRYIKFILYLKQNYFY
jgi:hypothetical protein